MSNIYYATVGVEENGKKKAVVFCFRGSENIASKFSDERIAFANIYPKAVAYKMAEMYNDQYKLMGVLAE